MTLRDAFGKALNDCTECGHAQVAPYRPGAVLMAVMCEHDEAKQANGGVPWAAACARDYVCGGKFFVRAKS
jgi:hypothetical protein